MPTHLMGIPYMAPNQINKDLVFNEAITLLDNLCTISVSDLVDELSQGEKNVKYIMTAGIHRHQIAYHSVMIGDWRYIKPQKNMLVFVTAKRSYAIYNGENWELVIPKIEPIILTQPTIKVYEVDAPISLEEGNTFYVYVVEECTISIGPKITGEFTIIFAKANAESVARVHWNTELSWIDEPYEEVSGSKAIEIVKFYIIPDKGLTASILKK